MINYLLYYNKFDSDYLVKEKLKKKHINYKEKIRKKKSNKKSNNETI